MSLRGGWVCTVSAERIAMNSQLGPIDIECDAPSYSIVGACQTLGFLSPLDVRWCRLSHFRDVERERSGVPGFHPWTWLFGSNAAVKTNCPCGQSLPMMERCTFTFPSGRVAHYYIGQCSLCHAIYWEELTSNPTPAEAESESWGV
jgi:hypothetical protein